MSEQAVGCSVREIAPAHRERLERKSSKSRLSKQEEVEEVEDEDNSPSSEASDATIVPAAGVETPVVHTPGGSPESNSPDDKDGKKLESQRSTDSDKGSPTQGGNPKVKLLVRSHALCDDASPPPEDSSSSTSTSSDHPGATLSVATLSPTPQHKSGRHKLEKDSSQSSMSESGASPCLSRDSSVETQYTDSTGIDLEEWIRKTLEKNTKDRTMLLKLEQDLINFIKDNKHKYLKFPQMSSYHRMLVHRVAAFFGLDHNVDQSGKCVMVNRTDSTRIPDFKFRDHIRDDLCVEDQPKKLILKRDSASFDEGRSPERYKLDGMKSKSFEEREEEYEKARARIFNQQDSQSSQELLESPMSRASTRSSARSSKEDLRWAGENRLWSSTDSSGYSTDTSTKLKVAMTKASSFGGVTVLSRGDSRTSNSGGRLSKTDSLSSGTSSLGSPMTRPPPIPSSPPLDNQMSSESGSSSQSAASPSQPGGHSVPTSHNVQVVSSNPKTTKLTPRGGSPSPCVIPPLPFPVDPNQPMAVWVATSLDAIPPGSIIINPQSGQPYLNPDGSVYRYQHQPAIRQQPPPPPQPPAPNQQQMAAPAAPSQAPMGLTSPQQPYQPAVYPQQQQLQAQQQQVLSIPDYKPTYTVETSGDLSQHFSQMSLTQASGLDGSGEAPGQTGNHGVFMVSPQQGGMPQQSAPPQQQAGYVQPTQQVPFYSGNQGPSGQSVRYVYPGMPYMQTPQQGHTQGQGSLETPGQGQNQGSSQLPQQQQQAATGQYGNQTNYMQNYSSYPMMGYSSMTVQSVEGYSQPNQSQTYQPQGAVPGYAPPQNTAPPGGGQGDVTGQMVSYSQYQQGGATVSVAPTSYTGQSMPVYYNTTPSSNGVPPAGYPGVATAGGSVTAQGSYRPRSPPSQGVVCSQAAPPMGTVTVSTPQYMSYSTYPPAGGMAQPRPQPPPLAPFPSIPPQSTPQPFPLVRPNIQVAMSMATRTTPPPQTAQYAPVSMVTAGQMKVVSVEPRPPKPNDLYGQDMVGKDVSMGTPGITVQGQPIAMPAKPATTPMGVRPTMIPTAPYRAPTPMNPGDVRLLGQPLQQQFARPQLQPLFTPTPRPRLQTPVMTGNSKPSKGRKSWARGSKDSASPHSSTESTESSESSAPSTTVALEVFSFPPNTKRVDIEGLCGELTKLGARLHVETNNHQTARGSLNAEECSVLALFDCKSLAQQALVTHHDNQYRLRPVAPLQSQCTDVSPQGEPPS